MGFYADFLKTNGSGQHTFDASVLNQLASFELATKSTVPDGQIVQIKDATSKVVTVDDVLVHQNGRVGNPDFTKDVVVMPIAKLALMPDAIQAAFFQAERVPGGYRKDLK